MSNSGYPIIMNGDHAEFEREHANTPPKERPDWPLPSFDARDWAEAFRKIAFSLGYSEMNQGWLVGWFANALMRGFDEASARTANVPTPAVAEAPDGESDAEFVDRIEKGRIPWTGNPVRMWTLNLEAGDYDRLIALARAKIARLEAERDADGWQDIETAPKDGRRFLGAVEGWVRIVAWGKTSHVPLFGFCLADQGVEDFDLCGPTHWRPLPIPPALKTGAPR